MTHHLHHRWLRDDEKILWHGIANRGADNTRQVGGILYLTDQRLFFEPHILERATQEQEWQTPLAAVRMTIEPGSWDPHIPIVRDFALRYHLEVVEADGTLEDFFVTHLGEQLERFAHQSLLRPHS